MKILCRLSQSESNTGYSAKTIVTSSAGATIVQAARLSRFRRIEAARIMAQPS